MMGWLSSVGSMSRMSVPIFVSYAFKYTGPNYTFLFVALAVFLSNIAMIVFYPLIIPLKVLQIIHLLAVSDPPSPKNLTLKMNL